MFMFHEDDVGSEQKYLLLNLQIQRSVTLLNFNVLYIKCNRLPFTAVTKFMYKKIAKAIQDNKIMDSN